MRRPPRAPFWLQSRALTQPLTVGFFLGFFFLGGFVFGLTRSLATAATFFLAGLAATSGTGSAAKAGGFF